jgi:hypothetical protein
MMIKNIVTPIKAFLTIEFLPLRFHEAHSCIPTGKHPLRPMLISRFLSKNLSVFACAAAMLVSMPLKDPLPMQIYEKAGIVPERAF